METPIALSMKFRLVDLLHSWLLSGLSLVARYGFLLALMTGFTVQPIGAAEPTNSVLHFDGNGSYLELPPHSLDGYKALTVEAWVRPERLGYSTRFFEFGTQKDRLVANWMGAYTVRAQSEASGVPVMGSDKGFISRYESNGWIHLTVVADGNGFQSYLNGDLVFKNKTTKPFYPAGNGKHYYFGKATFGGDEEDFIGQMDEIRIWDKALSTQEIKSGFTRRAKWGSSNLIALVNSETNRIKGIDGKEKSNLFQGALNWKVQERSLAEVSRTLSHQYLEIIFPPEIYSLDNVELYFLKFDRGVAYGLEKGFKNHQITTNASGSLIYTVDLHWFPEQFATEICLLATTSSNEVWTVVYPINSTVYKSSTQSVYLKRVDTNDLRHLLKIPFTQAIRERREVVENINFLNRFGLKDEATEALIDAAVTGGYQSYSARALLRKDVPSRLAKFYQVRRSVSARFLGGIVAALGLVMGCLWIFNRRMSFALWFGFTCVPVSIWLLLGENIARVPMRLAVLCALVPLLFGFVRSTLDQKMPLRCWLPIVALLPTLGFGFYSGMNTEIRVADPFNINWFWLNLASVAQIWLLVETALSFKRVSSSVSILQRRLVLWVWISALIICVGIPSVWFTYNFYASSAAIGGDLFNSVLKLQ